MTENRAARQISHSDQMGRRWHSVLANRPPRGGGDPRHATSIHKIPFQACIVFDTLRWAQQYAAVNAFDACDEYL